MARILCLIGLIILFAMTAYKTAPAQTTNVPPVVIPPQAPSICTTDCQDGHCTTICF